MNPSSLIMLTIAALLAGFVNGLLGQGFSSLMVPTGLLMAPARLLNPALVIIELPLNGGAAWLHRHRLRKLAGELAPFALALLPGVLLGVLMMRRLPDGLLKAACYGLLLLLVCAQFLGPHLARPSSGGPMPRWARIRFGFGTGALYGLTTISGPILAAYAHRRGYLKNDARAALAILRVLEGVLSLIALIPLGLIAPPYLRLAAILLPAALLGLLIGHGFAAKVEESGFRRLALGFNLLAVLAGLARALSPLTWIPAVVVPALWTGAALTALWLLFDWAPALFSRPGAST
ncbi:MAG: sulfite exporter TauE/SafE family protein [Acidobacteria bacterium]|nr:sulfite exporter TauE/SafE family protein [Acidobacteriota bacterium]